MTAASRFSVLRRAVVAGALAAARAWAQDVAFDIQPRVLQAGEAATITLTVHGSQDAPAPRFPDLDGFQVRYNGPMQNVSFVNGKMDASVSHRYALVALRAGKFRIGPFQYAFGGKTNELPAVDLEVVAGGATPGGEAAPGGQRIQDLLFARISATQTSVYHQQIFDLELSIYHRGIQIDSNVQLLDLATTGLKLGGFQPLPSTRENVNGQVYEVLRFRAPVTALTAGTFELAPALRVNVASPEAKPPRRPRSLFDDFFGDSFFGRTQYQPVDVAAPPLSVVVKPLPAAGRPAAFAGAVGTFAFDVQAQPLDGRVGDPVTLTMTVSGRGNLDQVAAPRIAEDEVFRVYESRLVSSEGNAAGGRKVFEQVVIPRTAASTSFPPVVFAYFDPDAGAYRTVSRGPVALALRPGTNEGARLVQGAGSASAPTRKVLGSDIDYLKPAPRAWAAPGRPWFANRMFLAVQATPPLALFALFLAARRREELRRDVSKARRALAPKVARAAMARAEAALAAGDGAAFHDALWDVLTVYFGHRLNLPPGDVTADGVRGRLGAAGAPAATLDQLAALFRACEAARFGGAPAAFDRAAAEAELRRMQDVLRAAEAVRC